MYRSWSREFYVSTFTIALTWGFLEAHSLTDRHRYTARSTANNIQHTVNNFFTYQPRLQPPLMFVGMVFITFRYISLFSCASSWSSRLGLYMIHTLHVRRPLSNLKFTLLGESVSIARKTTNQKISFSLFAVRFCVWCVIDVSFAWVDCLSRACASSYVFCVVFFLLACSPA